MADTAGKPNAGYTLTLGSATATSQRILSQVASVRRKEKGKIQMVIVTGSRERAFFLFASICRQARNVPLTCHASVGSLKFERDLKALHFGVDVLIVTSGEKMALYAANNISSAVRNFEDRSYARVFGIVLNHRNVENETEKVQAFSEKIGVPIVGEVPRSDEIIHWEEQGKTVIEGDPTSRISKCFLDLAALLWKEEEGA